MLKIGLIRWCCLVATLLGASTALWAYGTPSSNNYYTYLYRAYMVNVEFGGVSKSSTNVTSTSSPSYHDYTDTVGLVNKGENFQVKVTRQSSYYTSSYRYYWVYIWIDWNQSDTLDSNERYHINYSSYSQYYTTTAFNFNITPPANQLAGDTRMRVRLGARYSYGSVPTYIQANSYYNYMESEDYTIKVYVPPVVNPLDMGEAWERTAVMPKQITATGGEPPYTYSVNDVSNGNWVQVGPSTGIVSGIAPPAANGATSTFAVNVTDQTGGGASNTGTLTVKPALSQPLSENFDGATNGQYMLRVGNESAGNYTAGIGVSNSTGVRMQGTSNAGWNVTTALANDPELWVGAAALPNTVMHESYFNVPNASLAQVSFKYRIHNTSNSAIATNLAVLVSDDYGASWKLASGQNAESFGGYRADTGGQFVSEQVQFNVSGLQDMIGVRLVGLVRNPMTQTYIDLDDVDFFIPMQITTDENLPVGQQQVPYAPVRFDATGGRGTMVTWSVDPMNPLPQGLELVQSNGKWYVQGVPASPAGGGFQVSFGLIATDDVGDSASKIFNLTLTAPPANLQFLTDRVLPTSAPGASSVWDLDVIGGLKPYTFSIANPDDNPWLSIDPATGVLSGTVATPAEGQDSFLVTVDVSDSADRNNPALGADFQDSTSFEFEIPVTSRIRLDPEYYADAPLIFLPAAESSRSYNRSIPLLGGSQPYSWELTSGSLPPGITLRIENGSPFLSGAPAVGSEGQYTFTMVVNDFSGYLPSDPNYVEGVQSFGTQERQFVFNMTVGFPGVSELTAMTDQSLFDTPIPQGSSVAVWLAASGGRPPYNFGPTLTGLPEWASISEEGKLMIDAPMGVEGTFLFPYEVVDTAAQRATQTLLVTIEVTYNQPMVASPDEILTGYVASYYSYTLSVAGGEPPFIWSMVGGVDESGEGLFSGGGLPNGVTFNPATATVSGLIQGDNPVQSYSFDVSVLDGRGNMATKTLTMPVQPMLGQPLSVSDDDVEPAIVNQPYALGLQSLGGVGIHSWNLKAGTALPPNGLVLTEYGILTGVPQQTGTFTFTVEVRDEAGSLAERTILLSVMEEELLAPGGDGETQPVGVVSSEVEGAGSGCSVAGGASLPWLFALLGCLGIVALRRRQALN